MIKHFPANYFSFLSKPVKLHKDILDLLLGLLVNILLVVSDQGLGQRLSDGVHLHKKLGVKISIQVILPPLIVFGFRNLASVAATLNADPDVNISKPESS